MFDQLKTLIESGVHVEIGPHCDELNGYYCQLYKDSQKGSSWAEAGHGHTVEEAAEAGIALYQYQNIRKPVFRSSEEFQK